MSKIALTGNASGSGTFTLAAPNSDTDRVLTLPDSAGTIATTNGITMADEFMLTADLEGNNDPITTWKRVDTILAAQIGTGMSVSSGQFTFPETGIYLVTGQTVVDENGGGADNSVSFDLMGTEDNFATADIRLGNGNVTLSGSNNRGQAFVSALVRITDTANHKVQFRIISQLGTNKIFGEEGQTKASFIRLGDAA